MSIGLQTALGAGAGALILLLLSIVSRGGRKVFIPVCACLTLTAAACGVVGERVFINGPAAQDAEEEESSSRRSSRRGEDDEEEEDGEEADDEGSLALETAYALMAEGEYDLAQSLLDDYLTYGVYDADFLACKARLAMLRGDYTEAEGLYAAAGVLGGEDGPSFRKETKALEDWKKAKSEEAEEDIRKETLDGIEKAIKHASSQSEDAAAAMKAMRDLSSQEWLSEDEIKEKKEIVLDFAEGLKKSVRSRALNRVRLTGDLYAEDYEALLERLGDSPDGDSLLVVSELIRAEEISRKDLKDVPFLEEQAEDAQFVLDWIDAHRDGGTPLTKDEEEWLDGTVEHLEDVADGGEETFRNYVKDEMEKRAQSEKTNASKLYLELSQIAREEGDDAKAADYLNKSLEKAADSDDGAYAGAAAGINAIRQDPDNTEARKDLSGYAAAMVDNRFPSGVPVKNVTGSPADPGDTPGEDPAQPAADSLTTYVDNTVNQSLGQLNIVAIDTAGFPTVKLAVAMDEKLGTTAEEFKNHVTLRDCDIRVDTYEVQKVTYDTVNLIICVDDSGSMDGARATSLRAALTNFLKSDLTGVNVALIPFASGIKTGAGFGSSKEELQAVVDGLYGNGGTNIYGAAEYCVGMFPNTTDELNILILMSDGEDGTPTDDQLKALASACAVKGVSLYSMGLGSDVDSQLMNTYAAYCGGEFYYVNDANTLLTFYQYIFNLSRNRYEITFEAPDQQIVSRTVRVEHDSSTTVFDERHYSLYESDISSDDLGTTYDITFGGVTINGLQERLMYPCNSAQEAHLKGKEFDKDAVVTVSLHGVTNYDCTVEYVDSETYNVSIPAQVVTGIYDVWVEYNGRRAVFAKGFVMGSNNANVVRFGEYVFTASNVSRSGSTVTMDGVVQLNGFLTFLDPVSLTGDLKNDYSVRMSAGRTMLAFVNDGTATGLSKIYAEHGYCLTVPDFGDVNLYNDARTPGSSDEYPVDKATIYDGLFVFDFGTFKNAGAMLYPDRLVVDFAAFTSQFPFQNALVRKIGADEWFAFSLDHSEKLIYSQNSIDCDISITLGANTSHDSYSYREAKLGNMNFKLAPGSFTLEANTREGNYKIEALANVAMLADGIGLSLEWADSKFDAITLKADYEFNTFIANVPVTFHDFSLGIADLSQGDGFWDSILLATWKGGASVSMAKISAVYPGLEDWLDDAAIASLEDILIEFHLRDLYISAEATAKLLGFIELGHAKVQIGAGFPYSNGLLGIESKPAWPFNAELTVGPKLDVSLLKLIIQATVKLPLNSAAFGIGASGQFEIEVGWWFPVWHMDARGEVFLGGYEQHNGKWVFLVMAQGGGGKPKKCVFGETDYIETRKY